MADFYLDTLNTLIRKNRLRRDMKVLVACGGECDRDILNKCGFTNVTISNLDSRMTEGQMAPFQWDFQDVEDLTYPDDEFDVTIAHLGLHHCRSPHRALLEMYRVSKEAVIVFEPSDNVVTRAGVRLGLGQEYELAAVAGNGCRYGGQRNTPIPNYVYRWTTTEVEKIINTYAPFGKHTFLYFHAARIPWYRSRMMSSRLLDAAFAILTPVVHFATYLMPWLSNNLAFVILKPNGHADLHPWLTEEDGHIALNTSWIKERYEVDQDQTS